MIKLFFTFLLFSLLFSCKKNKSFDFPKGSWELKSFVINNTESPNFKLGETEDKYVHLLNNCQFSYYGSNVINFNSEKGNEKFKIKNCSFFKDSICYTEGNIKKYGFNFYKLNIKSKKGKSYEFQYCLINDTTIIGEFWEKGQNIMRFDAPNNAKVSYAMMDNNGNYYLVPYYTELLGVYHLKK